MGTGEESTASKSSKPTSSQDIPMTPAYPDWSNPMQAYYGAGATPPPFFASTVASPTPHPYLWGSQHPLMPPYGTPVPYPAIYPPGGVYPHPNMAMTPVSAPTNNNEVIGKGTDGKDGASSKKNKGTLENAGAVGNKTGDGVRATSGSGNDGGSHSGESGSEGSSDANEDNNQQEFGASGTAQNNAAGTNVQASMTGKPANSGPATNLNMGMDLWNSSSAAGAAKMRPAAASSAMVPGAMMSDQWIPQDERELKRQRRKQSNRESARRSRLRKQAECEDLQVRVETLVNENGTLREEMQRLSKECEKLSSENSSIKEELTRLCGPEAVAALEQNSTAGQSQANEE